MRGMFRLQLAFCLLALTASSRVLAAEAYTDEEYYDEEYADGVNEFVDDYEYDADAWAESYDYSSEDQATKCLELENGTFEVSSDIDKCDFEIKAPVGILQDGVGPIGGVYKMAGCRKGFPYYLRKAEDADEAPRIMWFSPEYGDWTISETAKKELAAKSRYLVAYGPSDYQDSGSLMPTGQWHIARSIAETDEFYQNFSITCKSTIGVEIESKSDEFAMDDDYETADLHVMAGIEGKATGKGMEVKPKAKVTYENVEDIIEDELDEIEKLLEADDVSNAVKAELEDEAAELEEIEADLEDGVDPTEVLQEIEEEDKYVDEAIHEAEEDQVVNTIYTTIEEDLDTIDDALEIDEVSADLKDELEDEAEDLEELEYDLDAGADPDEVIAEVLAVDAEVAETMEDVKEEEAEILYAKLDNEIDAIDDALATPGLDYVTVEELEDEQDALLDLEDDLDAGADPMDIREDVKFEEEEAEDLLNVVEEEAEVNELSEALEESIAELENAIDNAGDIDIEMVEALVDEQEVLEDLQYELEAGADLEQLYETVLDEEDQADDLLDAMDEAHYEAAEYAQDDTKHSIPSFCRESADGIVAGANLKDCDLDISVGSGLFAKSVGQVSGVYAAAGCMDGYPFYLRQKIAAHEAPRMLWFSTNYGDWSISEASEASQIADSTLLMAWGGADELDIDNVMPGYKWHVVNGFDAPGGNYYSSFNVKCVSPGETVAESFTAAEVMAQEALDEVQNTEPRTSSANGVFGMGGLVLLGFAVAGGFVAFKSCGSTTKPKYEKLEKTGHMV